MEKHYETWFPQKKIINTQSNPPSFKEREIWWCQIGVNIGFEIFGKSDTCTRPVLILKKYSRFTFLGAPLSTTDAKFMLHVPISIKGKDGIIRLDQLRTYDARRLQNNGIMHRIPTKQFDTVKQIFIENL